MRMIEDLELSPDDKIFNDKLTALKFLASHSPIHRQGMHVKRQDLLGSLLNDSAVLLCHAVELSGREKPNARLRALLQNLIETILFVEEGQPLPQDNQTA